MTLLSKDHRRGGDVFDVVLTRAGVGTERQGDAALRFATRPMTVPDPSDGADASA